MFVFGSLALAYILFIGINVLMTAQRAAAFPKYWESKADQPIPADAIRLVALGDSIMQAIGAADPENGLPAASPNNSSPKRGDPYTSLM